jgi:hypothetical protein
MLQCLLETCPQHINTGDNVCISKIK